MDPSASTPGGHALLTAVGAAIALIVAAAIATISASAIFRAVAGPVARAIRVRSRRATMGSNVVRLTRVCTAGPAFARRLDPASL
jgi:hypothetical protein